MRTRVSSFRVELRNNHILFLIFSRRLSCEKLTSFDRSGDIDGESVFEPELKLLVRPDEGGVLGLIR